jgi:hypothetical protein
MNRLSRLAVGILVAIVIAQGVALYLGRRALWEARVATANAKAERDTTRAHLVGRLLVSERLAQQLEVKLTAAQRRPGLAPQVAAGIAIAGKKVIETAPATAVVDTAVLVIESKFDGRDTLGVFISTHSEVAGLAFRPPVAPPTVWTRFDVTREPFLLEASVSCDRHDAVVQVSGPRWAAIDLTRPRVDPEICNPKPPAWRPFSFKAPGLPVVAALVGLGYLLAK